MSQETKLVLKSAKWTALESIIQKLLSTSFMLLMARIIGPASFGEYAIITPIIGVVEIICIAGINTSLIQFKKISHSHWNTAFTSVLALSTAGSICIFLQGTILSQILSWNTEFVNLIRLLSIEPIINSLSVVHIAKLTRELKFNKLAIVNMLSSAIGGFAGIGCALYGFGPLSLAIQSLTILTATAIFAWLYTRWMPKLEITVKPLVEFINFGKSVIGYNVISQYNRRLPTLLSGLFFGPEIAGFTALGVKISEIWISIFTQSFNKIAFPYFSQIKNLNRDVLPLFYKLVKLTSLISLPSYVILLTSIDTIIPLLMGKDWGNAIPIIHIIIIGGSIQSISFYNASLLVALGLPLSRLKTTLVRAISGTFFFFAFQGAGLSGFTTAYFFKSISSEPYQIALISKELPDFALKNYFASLQSGITCALSMLISVLMFEFYSPKTLSELQLLTAKIAICVLSYVIALTCIERQLTCILVLKFNRLLSRKLF